MQPLSRVLQSLTIASEQTVEVQYCDNVRVTEEDMRELLEHLYRFTGNRPMKRLIIITKNSTLELKARHLLQEENKRRQSTILAEAVVVNSLAQKMTTNFYLKFIKDMHPCKFFTEVDKARTWLHSI